jgi:YggT family protein
MLVIRALLSWFARPYSTGFMRTLWGIYNLLGKLTDPIVSPVRKALSRFNTGPIDLSTLVTMFLIMAIRQILLMLLSAVG